MSMTDNDFVPDFWPLNFRLKDKRVNFYLWFCDCQFISNRYAFSMFIMYLAQVHSGQTLANPAQPRWHKALGLGGIAAPGARADTGVPCWQPAPELCYATLPQRKCEAVVGRTGHSVHLSEGPRRRQGWWREQILRLRGRRPSRLEHTTRDQARGKQNRATNFKSNWSL